MIGVLVTAWMASLLVASAEKAPAASAAENETTHTISLPSDLKMDAITQAVSAAFSDIGWTNVTVNKDTVTASYSAHKIKANATAVCVGSEVKVVATYEPGSNTPERAKATVRRWLSELDKNSKAELGMPTKAPKKDKKADKAVKPE